VQKNREWLTEGYGEGNLVINDKGKNDQFWLDMTKTAFGLQAVSEDDVRQVPCLRKKAENALSFPQHQEQCGCSWPGEGGSGADRPSSGGTIPFFVKTARPYTYLLLLTLSHVGRSTHTKRCDA
jgi:hypothetical protein